jgi:hypothetical protein
MQPLQKFPTNSNPADRSVDPAKVSPLTRAAFATGLAQSVFGGSYAPPAQAEWRDRSPSELAILRAMSWSGAGT